MEDAEAEVQTRLAEVSAPPSPCDKEKRSRADGAPEMAPLAPRRLDLVPSSRSTSFAASRTSVSPRSKFFVPPASPELPSPTSRRPGPCPCRSKSRAPLFHPKHSTISANSLPHSPTPIPSTFPHSLVRLARRVCPPRSSPRRQHARDRSCALASIRSQHRVSPLTPPPHITGGIHAVCLLKYTDAKGEGRF